MATILASSPSALAAWPDSTILTGHLAPASLVKCQQALGAYFRFCETPAQALQAASLARWRTHLAQHTALSPHTINRLVVEVHSGGESVFSCADDLDVQGNSGAVGVRLFGNGLLFRGDVLDAFAGRGEVANVLE